LALKAIRDCGSAPSSFGIQTIGQAVFGVFLLFTAYPLHKQCFLYLSICLIIVLGNMKVLMAKVGKTVKTALVSSNLPAWLKKEERLE
jgi:hypothetical protein